MSGINKVILVGHLGRDPEVKTIDNGAKVARFSLATTEFYRDKNGERKEITEWHNVTCWRNLAEIAEKYLTKGKQIYVEGKIRSRSWEDGGVKKYATDIVADSFTMLGSKSDATDKYVSNETEEGTMEEPPFMKEDSDDLPF
ncbi:MAG TPA: single-stranded DNA-binding protein [Bacteroidales bacterium]|jgi:single-strand DNA-binding protein|nr:single-stranded DNA-binding protein [Bacteroidales bacterium]HOF15778.1 single-stranded DNA-binding protein [Bacteroidales bacterium]HON20388.1 single-stranded DNA-binding protein [Bacteroidales bacterium]HOR81239.1 single-stranded DNA-binding protein [Bacteroidales bacterium]HPJ90506.1 single-stranded DNA-binding protein [Bacteroidales bacterium]